MLVRKSADTTMKERAKREELSIYASDAKKYIKAKRSREAKSGATPHRQAPGSAFHHLKGDKDRDSSSECSVC